MTGRFFYGTLAPANCCGESTLTAKALTASCSVRMESKLRQRGTTDSSKSGTRSRGAWCTSWKATPIRSTVSHTVRTVADLSRLARIRQPGYGTHTLGDYYSS